LRFILTPGRDGDVDKQPDVNADQTYDSRALRETIEVLGAKPTSPPIRPANIPSPTIGKSTACATVSRDASIKLSTSDASPPVMIAPPLNSSH
jgi:hypothetical protein